MSRPAGGRSRGDKHTMPQSSTRRSTTHSGATHSGATHSTTAEEAAAGSAVGQVPEEIYPTDSYRYDLIEALKERQRAASRIVAEQIDALVEFARRRPANPSAPASAATKLVVATSAHHEIARALTLTRRDAKYRLRFAIDVTERIPCALDALRRGDLDLDRLKVIARETAPLPAEQANARAEELLNLMKQKPYDHRADARA